MIPRYSQEYPRTLPKHQEHISCTMHIVTVCAYFFDSSFRQANQELNPLPIFKWLSRMAFPSPNRLR